MLLHTVFQYVESSKCVLPESLSNIEALRRQAFILNTYPCRRMSTQHHVCLRQVGRSGKGGSRLDHQGWLHKEALRKAWAGLVRFGHVDRKKRGYEQKSESGEHKWNSQRTTKKLYSRNQEVGFFLTWKSLIFVSPSSKTWFPRSQVCALRPSITFSSHMVSSRSPPPLPTHFPSVQEASGKHGWRQALLICFLQGLWSLRNFS